MSSATITSPKAASRTSWQIDAAHTEVGFEVKHLMIARVRGRFAGVSGSLLLDEADLSASSVEVEIDSASIDTRQEQRDAHLRSPDFFDAEQYPLITFKSRHVEQNGDGAFRVIGDLTIRNASREVVLDVTDEGRARDPWGGDRAAFSARGRIDRTDFGLTWNQVLETGGIAVGNEIRISIEIEAVKQAA